MSTDKTYAEALAAYEQAVEDRMYGKVNEHFVKAAYRELQATEWPAGVEKAQSLSVQR